MPKGLESESEATHRAKCKGLRRLLRRRRCGADGIVQDGLVGIYSDFPWNLKGVNWIIIGFNVIIIMG